jgi:hypothetical protein
MPSDTESMSLERAAAALEWSGPNRAQRLRRLLLQRESEQGRLIMTRRGTPERWAYRVTLARLKECCPELFGGQTETAIGVLRRHLSTVNDRLASQETRLVRRISQVLHHSERTRQMVEEVATKVNADVSEVGHVEQNDIDPQFIESTQEKRGWFD